jgi:hypothetical protein
VVFELDEIKDENDKSLLMALIVTRLAETIKQRYLQKPGYRHLTLIEEAHRLLAKPEPGEGGSKSSAWRCSATCWPKCVNMAKG